jgi:RNA-directed DNA polymerase
MLTPGATRWSLPLPHLRPNPILTEALARSLAAGGITVEAVAARLTRTLGRPWRWIPPFAKRYVQAFAGKTRPRERQVITFLRADPGFQKALAKHGGALQIADWQAPPAHVPAPAAQAWSVPTVPTEGELAAWLGISVSELEWLADLKNLGAKCGNEKLHHYRYRILAKDAGSVRLIEMPKPRLKEIQHKILNEILAAIPAHPTAHGFVRGRSIKTFAAPHTSRRVILRMDLCEFFPRLSRAHVQALFRTAGYAERVADLLGGLCTGTAPRDIWTHAAPALESVKISELRRLYAAPHLPQGAPTSPALANLCAFRADCRLHGLARAAGALYTRYADDLAFSGGADFEARVERFAAHVAAVLAEEDFHVNHRKTRIMRQGVRQYLAGVVANRHVNVVRADFDRLKAALTNCVHHGPASQNREKHPAFRQHLAGRVAFVEMINPQKGARLRKIFDRIDWSES